MITEIERLRRPLRLLSRDEVPQRPCPVPAVWGVYAWWFREVPPTVPAEGAVVRDRLTLLYVGIPPSREGSQATLRSRVWQHYRWNASGSTLRLTLGCLLGKKVGIGLCPVGSNGRMTFGVGEQKLSEWTSVNAFVCWVEHPRPWEIEGEIIRQLRPPLNLGGNREHPFHTALSTLRRSSRAAARE